MELKVKPARAEVLGVSNKGLGVDYSYAYAYAQPLIDLSLELMGLRERLLPFSTQSSSSRGRQTHLLAYMLAGCWKFTVEGEDFMVEPGRVFFLPADLPHQWEMTTSFLGALGICF